MGVVTFTGLQLPTFWVGRKFRMQTPDISFKRHRFAPQIVSQAVWLYLRFNLSLREVEEMLLERGRNISYERIRRWIAEFGPHIAHNLRRRQARPGDVWYLDAIVVKCAADRAVADQLLDVCQDPLPYFLHPDIIAMERTLVAKADHFPEIVPVLEDVRIGPRAAFTLFFALPSRQRST